MNNTRYPIYACLAATIVYSLLVTTTMAGADSQIPKPDFTQGETIPEGATHDWNLGATGARGWMYSSRLCTSDARQIAITKVEQGSPADGILEAGDVILGVAGKPFSFDPRTEFGQALTATETEAGEGKLSLIRWRDGKTDTVVVNLPVLGAYSATAPYDCPKSERILEQGLQALSRRMADPSYRENAIVRSLNGLALLASGDAKYQPLLKREAEWAAGYSTGGFQTWWYGYTTIFLAEYVIAIGDDSVMPGLRRLAVEAAEGQSIVGSWGHGFAKADGRLGGYGMMNSPGIPLTIGMILARKAGVDDPRVEQAIEKSARLIRFYRGKGAIPYGDHAPWMQTHEDNGKCGMAAVMFNLLGERDIAEFFSRMSVASHGAERDCGHTGNFFNILWALPGVAPSGPQATGAWMNQFGSWYFDLARCWDGTFVHQGPPGLRNDSYNNWDCTGVYLLAYAAPLKKIYLTGRSRGVVPELDRAAAQSLIDDGRGWSNLDRNSFYDGLTEEELLDRLGNWSPIVRDRAAMALARRGEAPVQAIVEMLDSRSLHRRYGACVALRAMGGKAAPAVPALKETLKADDLWLRVEAADALAAIGEPAMLAVPHLLRMLAKGPSDDDPRGMEQRYLCFSVFGKMLKQSLDGVDRDLLREAVAVGLQNEDGRARGSVGSIYRQLSLAEIKPLLPAIHEAVVTPAPSGIMFADGIRIAGLDLLASHHIKEGLPLCVDIMDIQSWGKQHRINGCLGALAKYGGAAKPLLPELRRLEQQLRAHREAKSLEPQIDRLHSLIEKIEQSDEEVVLRSLDEL